MKLPKKERRAIDRAAQVGYEKMLMLCGAMVNKHPWKAESEALRSDWRRVAKEIIAEYLLSIDESAEKDE